MPDVLIIGGGVIGLTTALELSEAGLSVTVVDQGAVGREASWAGAGMIPPGDPFGSTAARRLNSLSSRLWPQLSRKLQDLTGLDNGYRRCGGICLPEAVGTTPVSLCDAFRQADVEAEVVRAEDIQKQEPLLAGNITAGVFLPGMAQIRNPWHLQALAQACRQRRVAIVEGAPVFSFDRSGENVVAAVTSQGRIHAGTFVVAAGAWSTALLSGMGMSVEVRPIRGQIVLLRTHASRLRRIVEVGPRYLVPRTDGRLLVGSTEEDAGFKKETTAEGIQGLLEFARNLVPSTSAATFETCWSGLRPCAVRGRPYLGPVRDFSNLLLATGHFRSGLTNSPGTAGILRELMLGQPPSIDIAEFGVSE